MTDIVTELRNDDPFTPPTKHEALRADFYSVLHGEGDLLPPAIADVVADRLVHLVVLHGLLPETTQENR